MLEFLRNVLIYVSFMNFVRPFANYAIFCELCDQMRFEVDCAKSHHRVISEGLRDAISRHRFYTCQTCINWFGN